MKVGFAVVRIVTVELRGGKNLIKQLFGVREVGRRTVCNQGHSQMRFGKRQNRRIGVPAVIAGAHGGRVGGPLEHTRS